MKDSQDILNWYAELGYEFLELTGGTLVFNKQHHVVAIKPTDGFIKYVSPYPYPMTEELTMERYGNA